MAKRARAKKKRVGRNKICSKKYLSQIDPAWLAGPVPTRFWQKKKHRRDYLLWLADGLGLRRMEDLYELTFEDFRINGGHGLVATYWRSSPVVAVKQCFPRYEWHEWLFAQCPMGFWDDRRNHRRYMKWLGGQLGFRRPEDWYSVTTEDVTTRKGGAFLLCYRSSVSAAVMSHFPNYNWKQWMFATAPNGFWTPRKNRRRYMKWLGEQCGYTCLDDWHDVVESDFLGNYGRQLLHHYGGSPLAAVKDLLADRNWCEWRFARVPQGFWDVAENRIRYVKWLGKRLGYRRPEDWCYVRRSDFLNNCGGGLLAGLGSYVDLLREGVPELDWDQW